MKKHWLNVTLAAALAAGLTIPAAQAWERHDLIFDQTGLLLDSDSEVLSTQVLPDFTEQYGVELQVDVLMDLDGHTDLTSLAESWYDDYDYGYGEGENGVSLTLLVHQDVDGLALDDWYVYAGGDSWELTNNGPANGARGAEQWLSDGWYGDLEDDRYQFCQAVRGFRDGIEEFILAGGVMETIYDPSAGAVTPESPDAPELVSEADVSEATDYVFDFAGLLSGDEVADLTERAAHLTQTYDCGMYIMTVPDYTEFTDGAVADAAQALFGQYGMGTGSDLDGCMLLLSMEDRDYTILVHGYGNVAFSEYARGLLSDAFLDDFGDDDWYSGFSDYLDKGGELLSQARAGEPVDGSGAHRGLGIVASVLLALLIAFIVRGVLHGQLKSVATAGEAKYYVNESKTDMRVKEDQYAYTTQSRIYDPPKDEKSSSSSGGGFSSSSGKF